jgi:hypothetical protein
MKQPFTPIAKQWLCSPPFNQCAICRQRVKIRPGKLPAELFRGDFTRPLCRNCSDDLTHGGEVE